MSSLGSPIYTKASSSENSIAGTHLSFDHQKHKSAMMFDRIILSYGVRYIRMLLTSLLISTLLDGWKPSLELGARFIDIK